MSDYETPVIFEQVCLTVFCLIITSWSLFSYKMVETPTMVKFSLSLLIPTLICVEVLEGWRFYYLTYVQKKEYISPGDNFIERHSMVFLLVSCFTYFTSGVIKLKKINLRNSAIVRMKAFSNKVLDEQGRTNSFNKLVIFIYESFFRYFQYLMLLITILTSMIEVNFLNFALILFCIGVISRHKSTNSTLWVYYVFFIDLCILVK